MICFAVFYCKASCNGYLVSNCGCSAQKCSSVSGILNPKQLFPTLRPNILFSASIFAVCGFLQRGSWYWLVSRLIGRSLKNCSNIFSPVCTRPTQNFLLTTIFRTTLSSHARFICFYCILFTILCRLELRMIQEQHISFLFR